MAVTRAATAHWEGSLMEGAGQVTFDSSDLGTYDVTWASRAEEPQGRTSPEELIAAAHATCFSMALSHALAGAGTPPTSLDTTAEVAFTPGTGITGIKLSVVAKVDGLNAESFRTAAEGAKTDCPVSQALQAVPITLEARLAD